MRRAIAAIRNGWERNRELTGKFAFEFVIVFIGVTGTGTVISVEYPA